MLKGGETIEFDAEPLSFLAVVAIEIAVSIYVVWAFLIARDDSSNEKE